MAKTKDICVKVGEYNGKGVWENVGAVVETSNGEMLLLKRTFNPAGVPNPDNKDSIILSLFDVKEKGKQGQGQRQGGGNGDNGGGYSEPDFDPSSDIPF